jgi:CO/xanthine dehydrogenase FAD-binding subunit
MRAQCPAHLFRQPAAKVYLYSVCVVACVCGGEGVGELVCHAKLPPPQRHTRTCSGFSRDTYLFRQAAARVYVHCCGVLHCSVAAILLQLGTVVEEPCCNRLLDAICTAAAAAAAAAAEASTDMHNLLQLRTLIAEP